MNKERSAAEKIVYEVMDAIDPSGANKEYWMNLFSGMSDAQFKSYISKPFPFVYQVGAFKEPSMDNIRAGLKKLGVPFLESIYIPYKYKDKDGNPMKSKECLVMYLHDKRMKQIVTKKNKVTTDQSLRDMKTGQLTGNSKGGRTSDREMEALRLLGLDSTTTEMNRARGDAMVDKDIMNNTIKNLGQVYLKDLPADNTDSLGRNNLSTMFIGAQLMTNLVSEEYLLPYTLKLKNKKIERLD